MAKSQPNERGTVTGRMYRLYSAVFEDNGIEVFIAARSCEDLTAWCVRNMHSLDPVLVSEVMLADAGKFVASLEPRHEQAESGRSE